MRALEYHVEWYNDSAKKWVEFTQTYKSLVDASRYMQAMKHLETRWFAR